ncbi:MAG: type II secretion system protein GspL [Gallionellaceae bacterium]|nr:MAG: type II secretion system protein GspL [Gallionellaceae bacterium]
MKLRIYFSAAWHDSASPCPWVLCDDAGAVLQSGNSPPAALPKADDYIAIISATRLMCVNVKMPAQSRHRWEAALPFVAEEYTLTDPEDNHVVPGAAQKDGQRSLFVVDKQWLQSIVAACHTANIPLRRAVPEMLLPNLPPETWVVVWDGDKGFMRTGATSGMALDHGDELHPPLALSLSLNATPPKNILLRCATHGDETELPQWPKLPVEFSLGEPWDWRREPIPNDTLNLLWGPLAPKAKLHEWLPKLRPAAFILLAALVIETLGTNIEWSLLSHEKTAVAKEMERTFRKAFGETSTVVNPPLQMQRNIAALRHGAGLPDEADFLPLLDRASSALSPLPNGSITALHYESGRLDVDVKLRTAAEVRALQQRLQDKGLSIRSGDVRDTGNGVETRLAIRAGGVL